MFVNCGSNINSTLPDEFSIILLANFRNQMTQPYADLGAARYGFRSAGDMAASNALLPQWRLLAWRSPSAAGVLAAAWSTDGRAVGLKKFSSLRADGSRRHEGKFASCPPHIAPRTPAFLKPDEKQFILARGRWLGEPDVWPARLNIGPALLQLPSAPSCCQPGRQISRAITGPLNKTDMPKMRWILAAAGLLLGVVLCGDAATSGARFNIRTWSPVTENGSFLPQNSVSTIDPVQKRLPVVGHGKRPRTF